MLVGLLVDPPLERLATKTVQQVQPCNSSATVQLLPLSATVSGNGSWQWSVQRPVAGSAIWREPNRPVAGSAIRRVPNSAIGAAVSGRRISTSNEILPMPSGPIEWNGSASSSQDLHQGATVSAAVSTAVSAPVPGTSQESQ